MPSQSPVDVRLCLSGRELSEPVPSPDGKWLVFGTRHSGRSAVALLPMDGGTERVLSLDPAPALGRGLGGGCIDWLADSTGIVYAGADGEVWLHRLDGSHRPLTTLQTGGPAQVDRSPSGVTVSPDGRHVAYIAGLAEVGMVSVDKPLEQRAIHDGSDFVMDPVWSPDGTSLVWQAWDVPNMPWDDSFLMRFDIVAGTTRRVSETSRAAQVQQPRFGSDSKLWWVSDESGWLNVQCAGAPVLDEEREHAGPSWGPGQRSFAVSPDGKSVVINRNEDGFGRLLLVELESGNVREVAKAVHGQIRWSGSTVTALRTGGRTPTQVVAYDMSRPAGPWPRRTLAVGPAAEWDQLSHVLVEPELLSVSTYQGARVPARAYRPADVMARAEGRMICWVHGGPTDQWQVTFMPRIAYWVARGWTVLVPEHRGSTVLGRAFQQAMRNNWGVVDTQDVAACVANAQAMGWSTPSRTVLMGGSAGGYTALNVLTTFPQVAAGAAVVYPVFDPVALADATHRFEAHYNDTLLGPEPVAIDPARLRRPVLILHGDSDPVVPVSQSTQFAERAAQHGAEVELCVMAGEGHGFRPLPIQVEEYLRIETFVSRIVQGPPGQ
ncbi:MAG: S9 family peptidase [Ilumatobacteraceae bacterium]